MEIYNLSKEFNEINTILDDQSRHYELNYKIANLFYLVSSTVNNLNIPITNKIQIKFFDIIVDQKYTLIDNLVSYNFQGSDTDVIPYLEKALEYSKELGFRSLHNYSIILNKNLIYAYFRCQDETMTVR